MHVKNRSAFGQLALDHIKAGTLTPDGETSRMFLSELVTVGGTEPIIVEGYPRTDLQMDLFLAFLNAHKWKLLTAFYLSVPKNELLARISDRLICPLCSRVYRKSDILDFDSKCKIDGATLSVRLDDSQETAPKRIDFYEKAETKVIHRLDKSGLLIRINGVGLASDVAQLLSEGIATALKNKVGLN